MAHPSVSSMAHGFTSPGLPGDAATGIIRLEHTLIANGAAENRVRTEVVTGMFLGDRRESLFRLGSLRLRCYGTAPPDGPCWLELPREALWLFPAASSG